MQGLLGHVKDFALRTHFKPLKGMSVGGCVQIFHSDA